MSAVWRANVKFSKLVHKRNEQRVNDACYSEKRSALETETESTFKLLQSYKQIAKATPTVQTHCHTSEPEDTSGNQLCQHQAPRVPMANGPHIVHQFALCIFFFNFAGLTSSHTIPHLLFIMLCIASEKLNNI